MASALNMLASEEANGGNVQLMNWGHTPAETLSKVLSDFHRVKDRVLFSKTKNKWEHAETACHEKQIFFFVGGHHIHLFKELYDGK